jgi:hypothetical protein
MSAETPTPPRRWQLRTWTKGTGATVEPEGAADAAPVRARPGGLTALPPKRQRPRAADRPAGAHRTADEAARRLAARHLDGETIEALLELRAQLTDEERR